MTDKSLRGSLAGRYYIDMHHYLVKLMARDRSLLADIALQQRAAGELYEISARDNDGPSRLEEWVGKYLTSKQRSNMLSALRQRRRRAMGVGKSITISAKAHQMLTTLAEKEGLTLSEVLEKRLKNAYKTELKRIYG